FLQKDPSTKAGIFVTHISTGSSFLLPSSLGSFSLLLYNIFILMGSSFLSSVPGQSIAGVAMNLSAEFTSIPVINGSIMIPCDGLYVVSLKGVLSPDLEKSSLKLMMKNTESKNAAPLWERDVQNSSNAVDLITMLYLFAQNNIILSTISVYNTSEDTPGRYCLCRELGMLSVR
uniref:TNF family profile domain-containing protein n=1 Tax=Gallus gallus TaxID=9031 RepID=A0A8V0YT01_CHICK